MRKFINLFSSLVLTIASLLAQDCSINPNQINDYVVSGCFAFIGNLDNQSNDVVTLRQSGNQMIIDVLAGGNIGTQTSNYTQTLYKNVSSFTYDLSKVSGKIVSGDFDNNGFLDEFAVLYKESDVLMKVDVFKSTSSPTSLPVFTKSTYLVLNGYDAAKVNGRVVSGDFDRDGKLDDIAMFFDYGNSQTRIHMLLGNGTSFIYPGSSGFWNSTGYDCLKITDRVVSGDFDQDGYIDDIAAFYEYGTAHSSIHVWLSTGISFSYQYSGGWWNTFGYEASRITGRVVSLNLDKGIVKHDDIVVFYDYGNNQTRMHAFRSNGSSFTYSGSSGIWMANGYDASKITNKVVAIDTRTGKSVSHQQVSDVLAFYDYGVETENYHMWRTFNPPYSSFYITYTNHIFCDFGKNQLENVTYEHTENQNSKFAVYPNPTNNFICVDNVDNFENGVPVKVLNSKGEVVYNGNLTVFSGNKIDISLCSSGLYFVQINDGSNLEVFKISKQ